MFSKEELQLMLAAIKMIEANTECKYLTYNTRVKSSIKYIKEQIVSELNE